MDRFFDFANRLQASLAALGARRLALLGAAGLIIAALLSGAGYMLSRPAYEVLYSGLDKQDATRISSALREAGIPFDGSADGATIHVRYGQTAQARMLLAEKGLPHGSSGGYELFDKLGSLGLTSFMQEVTKLRAVEGELARTIQLIKGVKGARVHIVLPDEGSFRRARQPATASVIIRTDLPSDSAPAGAIRRLVAAAVPGMTVENVTVLSSEGVLLSSADDGVEGGPTRLRQLERSVSLEVQDNIRKTLSPLLTLKNFQVSVTARVNADRRQTEETTYNPESRVERSVRTIKENQTAQNSNQAPATTVERNLPNDRPRTADGKSSSEENQKREEITNYELSSKKTQTVSGGYTVEALSIAVVINRAALAGPEGKAAPEAINAQLAEMEQLISSAAGLRKERGDALKISAVDFVALDKDFAAPAAFDPLDLAARHTGVIISSLAAVVIAVLVLLLGVRPLTQSIARLPEEQAAAMSIAQAALPAAKQTELIAAQPEGALALPMVKTDDDSDVDQMAAPKKTAQRKLEKIVDLDEDMAAQILKQWLREEQAA